jgi:precorrin-6B C5,15-methyltransferase / cobalt-precorrin-6B C5,C15-methyltransferase
VIEDLPVAAPATSRIAVVGVHAGRVAPGAEETLREARLVLGGTRHLESLAPPGVARVPLTRDLATALDALADGDVPACVLASGDPGFFGIVRVLAERFGRERLDVHPAPSSVAVVFARLGMPWDDALVVSAHARGPEAALHAAMRHPKVGILTDRTAQPAWFAERLVGYPRELAVGERLGEPDERVIMGPPERIARLEAADPNVVVVWDDDASSSGRARIWPPRTAPEGWALPETAFEHRAGMITKPEVRALVLARLGPGTGDLCWDVGTGSGSVAIECARLGAAAIGVDRDPHAIELARRNAAAHVVPVRFVEGAAPEVLETLPDPDAVFVGGGGGDLLTILKRCVARGPRAIVVSLAIVERVGPVLERLEADGFESDAVMLSGGRLRELPGGHRIAAENPVFVVSGRRRASAPAADVVEIGAERAAGSNRDTTEGES